MLCSALSVPQHVLFVKHRYTVFFLRFISQLPGKLASLYFKMAHKDGLSQYNLFVGLHQVQLKTSGVPEIFWKTLFKKLHKQIFDAGETFSIFRIEYEEEREETDPLYTVAVTKEDGVQCEDETQIYLIDHAWTYESNKAASNLSQIPGLLDRMCNLMGIDLELPEETKIENVCREMWRYNQTYSHAFGNVEDRIPVWYIMDEFGSAIQHSDEPNFRTVPFFYIGDQTKYTLLFPVEDVDCNEQVTRDFLEGPFSQSEDVRKALLLPWKYTSFLEHDFNQSEPSEDYFLSGHVLESLPDVQEEVQRDKSAVLKVYSDYTFVNEYLKDPGFLITDDSNEADILWLTKHFKGYKELSESFPEKFINQFPFENVITIKDLFAIVSRRRKKAEVTDKFADNPPWLPTTFNLKTELVEFVSYYQNRKKNNLNNIWICKPWNLARGLDTYITDNINCIVRLPATGPKIAQKYLENPVLFNRPDIGNVKFDIRYVVLLKSVSPLKVYAYKNFFLRFGNKPFELNEFWDYEKHFTVMNYNEETQLFRMLCDEFVEEFNKQNPGIEWKDVEGNIFKAFRELFEAATMKQPPCGIGHNVQSRALYAIDLMLTWERFKSGSDVVQPKILEVNWTPDCNRACVYYPDFYDDIFLLLFKDVENEEKFQVL